MNKPYYSYTLEELASDPYFKQWVLDPTPELEQFWEEFLQKNPQKAPLVQEAQMLIRELNRYFDVGETNPQQLKVYFDEVRQRADREMLRPSKAPTPTANLLIRWSIAASIALLIGIGAWVWLASSPARQLYATEYGEWEEIQLPDGSIVKLNADSELSLADTWEEGTERKVWLKGEAYFEVQKMYETGTKFIVVVEGVSVEVLGTSFNVMNRGEKTEVFLEEGSIRLETAEEEALMVPGDLIAYSSAAKQIVEKRTGVKDYNTTWKDGVLVFKEDTVAQIIRKIEEIYGVEFQIRDDSILNSSTTIRIPMDELDITLPILERTLGRNIQRQDDLLIVE